MNQHSTLKKSNHKSPAFTLNGLSMSKTPTVDIIILPVLKLFHGRKTKEKQYKHNSAYFYKYLIAPRLNKKPPTIRPDTDLNHRFKTGIIAIHWQKALIKNMDSLGIKHHEESGLLIFNLNHIFTTSEIKKLHARENEAKEKALKILKPTQTIPDLYGLFLILAQILPNKVRKMNEYYRNSYGPSLTKILIEFFETYIQLANNQIDKPTARRRILQDVDKINAIMIILNENHALDYSTEQRIGTVLAYIRNCVDRHLKLTKEEKWKPS